MFGPSTLMWLSRMLSPTFFTPASMVYVPLDGNVYDHCVQPVEP